MMDPFVYGSAEPFSTNAEQHLSESIKRSRTNYMRMHKEEFEELPFVALPSERGRLSSRRNYLSCESSSRSQTRWFSYQQTSLNVDDVLDYHTVEL